MKNTITISRYFKAFLLVGGLTFVLAGCSSSASVDEEKSKAKEEMKGVDPEILAKVDALMEKMSLEDKVGEMTQLTVDMLCVGEPYQLEEPHRIDPEKMRHALVDMKVGSILNVGGHAYTREHWYNLISSIQKVAMEEKSTGNSGALWHRCHSRNQLYSGGNTVSSANWAGRNLEPGVGRGNGPYHRLRNQSILHSLDLFTGPGHGT